MAYVIEGRNVNTLYSFGGKLLMSEGMRSKSRAGDVVVLPAPVMSVYQRPWERVLFDEQRNANPFFHLVEGLWMLQGEDLSTYLDEFVSDFGTRFAESDGRIHDAYGRRWRRAMGIDQLWSIVQMLRADPTTRQAVLQMWDSTPDGENDLHGNWKTRPCNTHAYFRVRNVDGEPEPYGGESLIYPVLDMTICCRSNDMIWGAYGANAVHFSMLMEFVAGSVGVGMGTMYQLSNNFHAYVDVLEKMQPLDQPQPFGPPRDLYAEGEVTTMRMGRDWSVWNDDLETFFAWLRDGEDKPPVDVFTNEWFPMVAVPMVRGYRQWKKTKDPVSSLNILDTVAAQDWRIAAVNWIMRRVK